ncbi:hypothetical protein V8359_19295, partial [Roseovarius sp. E0-M6]
RVYCVSLATRQWNPEPLLSRSFREEIGNEGNLVCNPGFTIFELALSDFVEGLDPSESSFSSGHGPEPAHWAQSLFQRGMVALDPIVLVLPVDVVDRIFRSEPSVDLTDHLGIAVCLVGDDGQRMGETCSLSGLSQE